MCPAFELLNFKILVFSGFLMREKDEMKFKLKLEFSVD